MLFASKKKKQAKQSDDSVIPEDPSIFLQVDVLLRCYSVPLILGIIAAIIHENVSPSTHNAIFETTLIPITDSFSITFEFLINEVFMMYFFGFVVKHVIQSLTPPDGSMFPLSRAIAPVVSSICSMIMPVALYILFIWLMDEFSTQYSFDTLLNGWAIPMSTDVALSWAVSTFVFNEHLDYTSTQASLREMHPCISFLLLLAICDDILGIVAIGIFYKKDTKNIDSIDVRWLLLVFGAMVLAFMANKLMSLHLWWYYIFIVGSISWVGFLLSGIHPAIALIPIMPFMVIYKGQRRRVASISDNEPLIHLSPSTTNYNEYSLHMLNKFEKRIGRFVEYGLFFFTYCNAAVQFSDFGAISLCVFASLFLGKISGITFGSFMVNKVCGFALPAHMTLGQIPLVGFCGAIGLIVALFISDIAWEDQAIIDQAKMGILCGAIFIITVALLYRFVTKPSPIYSMKHEPPIQSVQSVQAEEMSKTSKTSELVQV